MTRIARKTQKEKAGDLKAYRLLVQKLKDTEIPKHWQDLKKVEKGNKVLISTLEGFAEENPENLGAFVTALLEYAFKQEKRVRIYNFETKNKDLLKKLANQKVLWYTKHGSYHITNLRAESVLIGARVGQVTIENSSVNRVLFFCDQIGTPKTTTMIKNLSHLPFVLCSSPIKSNVVVEDCEVSTLLTNCDQVGTPKTTTKVTKTVFLFSLLCESTVKSNILIEDCTVGENVLCFCKQVGSHGTETIVQNVNLGEGHAISTTMLLVNSTVCSKLILENCKAEEILESAIFAKDAPSLTLKNTPNVSQNVKFEPSNVPFTIYYDKKSGKPEFEGEPKREIIYKKIK